MFVAPGTIREKWKWACKEREKTGDMFLMLLVVENWRPAICCRRRRRRTQRAHCQLSTPPDLSSQSIKELPELRLAELRVSAFFLPDQIWMCRKWREMDEATKERENL